MRSEDRESIQFVETKPLKIKEQKIKIKPQSSQDILVAPVLAGICGSDLHYYLGHKAPEKLKSRLPLVLLHEGVVKNLKTNELLIANPLIPCKNCPNCKSGNENYCQNIRFMASTAPGLAHFPFYYPKNRLLKIPKEIPLELAALAEPLSVCWNALEKIEIKGNQKLLVIGDGSIGFLLIFLAAFAKKIKKGQLFWLGRHQEKLKIAQDFSTPINTTTKRGETQIEKIKNKIDFVIEAVGGSASEQTIGLAIEAVRLLGKILLLGVTDDKVPIKTKLLLDKGIIVLTSNLMGQRDFKNVINFLKNKKYHLFLKRIINPKKFVIKNVSDFKKALDYAANKETVGKVLIKFDL